MLVLTIFRMTPCSQRLPRGSTSFGKSMLRTSTLPGPTYTTPRLLAMICCSSKYLFECLRARFRDRLVLLARTSADADGAHDLPVAPEWNSACEDHHAPIVGGVDAEELTAGLGKFREVLGADVEGACRERLFDRDIDAADPCLIHAHMGDEITAAIRDGDIHRLPQFLRLLLRRRNDPAGIFQCDHNNLLQVRRRRPPRFVVRQLGQHILQCHYRAISEVRASITVVTFDEGQDGALLLRTRRTPFGGARMAHRQLIFHQPRRSRGVRTA